MKILDLMTGAALLLCSFHAMAASQQVTASVAFDTPVLMTKVSDINFGAVKAGVADTYTITTVGNVTAAGGDQWVSGTKTPGNINISGTATGAVNISVSGYTTSGGVTLANATCSYDGAASGPCAINGAPAPGAGKTLLLGVDAVVDGTQTPNTTASPGFTVTVVQP
ncbi:MAG: hypothetical protein HY052_07700 [Proteobacteria bacterium]|nr:hypothetical protein [Pseudomonadota bacterium]